MRSASAVAVSRSPSSSLISAARQFKTLTDVRALLLDACQGFPATLAIFGLLLQLVAGTPDGLFGLSDRGFGGAGGLLGLGDLAGELLEFFVQATNLAHAPDQAQRRRIAAAQDGPGGRDPVSRGRHDVAAVRAMARQGGRQVIDQRGSGHHSANERGQRTRAADFLRVSRTRLNRLIDQAQAEEARALAIALRAQPVDPAQRIRGVLDDDGARGMAQQEVEFGRPIGIGIEQVGQDAEHAIACAVRIGFVCLDPRQHQARPFVHALAGGGQALQHFETGGLGCALLMRLLAAGLR